MLLHFSTFYMTESSFDLETCMIGVEATSRMNLWLGTNGGKRENYHNFEV
jgi:hypothetical protein